MAGAQEMILLYDDLIHEDIDLSHNILPEGFYSAVWNKVRIPVSEVVDVVGEAVEDRLDEIS